MKLRNMSACVNIKDIDVRMSHTGEIKHLQNCLVLTSYRSIVAAYDGKRVYLFPRYDYSITTWKHIRAFVQDCTDVRDVSADAMRRSAKMYNDVTDFAFVDGWINSVGELCEY